MIFLVATQQGASAYRTRVVLDGVTFLLDLNWNGRAGAWYMSLFDATGASLLESRKLVTNRPLLQRFRFQAGLPAGELLAMDPSAKIPYAQYDALGDGLGVALYYFDAAELGRA